MQIIDSLLVTLGLDSKPYKKGKDDATREQKSLKDNTKKSSGEMVQSLKAVTLQIGAMVVGFQSLRGAVGFLAGINNADAALGRLAANTGTNVRELNEWALAVELAGGSTDDAKADVTALASSITNLKATGSVSELLLLMQRLGVSIFDAEGNTRDLFTIMSEAGAKLSQFKRADAFQLARGAGLSEGTLNLLLMEEDARKRIFAQAAANNNMDLAAAERAAELQKQWRDIVQSARAFGRELLELTSGPALAFFKALKPAGESLRTIGLNNARVGDALATGINGVADAIAWLVEQLPTAQRFITDMLELLDQLAVKAMEVAQNIREIFSGISDTVASVGEFLFVDSNQEALPGTDRAPSNLARAAQERRMASYQARQQGAGGSPTTTVRIDEITVNVPNGDADAIAAELPAALARKGVVAQADTGMQ